MPSAHQTYGTHDPTYYSQQQSQYPAYLDSEPRQLPEVISYSPPQGQQGTKVTVHFRTAYNLDNPSTSIVMMFGQQRCSSVLSKTSHQGPPYEYALTAESGDSTFVVFGTAEPEEIEVVARSIAGTVLEQSEGAE